MVLLYLVLLLIKKIADKTISNLKEVKSRGANVIYVTTNSLNKDGDFYDEKVIIPDTNPLLQSLLTILPLQLTAYYVAKNKIVILINLKI